MKRNTRQLQKLVRSSHEDRAPRRDASSLSREPDTTAADVWMLRLNPSETNLIDRLRTFLNFYMDAAGLELQAIIHNQDPQHVAIAVAGNELKVVALRDRIREMYPDEDVWIES